MKKRRINLFFLILFFLCMCTGCYDDKQMDESYKKVRCIITEKKAELAKENGGENSLAYLVTLMREGYGEKIVLKSDKLFYTYQIGDTVNLLCYEEYNSKNECIDLRYYIVG